VARGAALAAALAASLLAVSGAGGAPAQTPKRGGTLAIGMPRHLEPACLNPYLDECEPNYLDAVLLGAFEVAPDATFRPSLANAEVAATKPFTLRYRIRPEARWSDGTPVTARDFVFTQQTIIRHRTSLHPNAAPDHLARVRTVRALDSKTFVVVLRDRFVDWRFLFPWVLPHHALAGEKLTDLWKDGIDNPKTGTAIGTGPFLVERVERGKQLVLRRNESYWGPHAAYLHRIAFRYLAPEDAGEAMRRGDVDMIDAGYPIMQPAALELRKQPAPGIKVLSALQPDWEHFDIRIGAGGHPALKRRLVRQALAYGVDRVEIARIAAEFAGVPASLAQPLDSVVFLPNSRYYRPSWKGYRYRPQEARRLLERAECRPGADGIYVCAGERLSLRFVAPAVGRRIRIVQAAQAQLRRIGVEVETVFGSPGTVFGQVLPKGDFDFILFGWIGGAGTAGPYDIFGCQRPQNFTGYCDRLVTRDLRQATRILDDERRVQLLNSVDARLAKAVPAIPLFQSAGVIAFDTSLRGVTRNGRLMWNVVNWWLER
jgi:peptide/nickel transport system substrate-binding protein